MVGTRRSARLGAKRPASPGLPETDVDASAVPEVTTDNPPRRKRRKLLTLPSAAQRRAKALAKGGGKLAKLTEMPMDILFEIFKLMCPFDLLKLSRTTKALRRILLDPHSKVIWASALASVPDPALPPCPADISEPRYAHLEFDTYCDFCLAPNIKTVQWECRVRCCKRCFDKDKHFVSAAEFAKSSDAVLKKLVDMKGMIPEARGYDEAPYYWTDQLKSLKRAYISTRKPLRDAFIADRKAQVAAIENHARLCRERRELIQAQYERDVTTLRDARSRAILDKLRAMGFGNEVNKQLEETEETWRSWHLFINHPFVRQAKELTPRAWKANEHTMSQLIRDMRAWRRQDLQVVLETKRHRTVHSLLADYLKTHPPTDGVYPPFADICCSHPLRDYIRTPFDHFTEEDNVPNELFQSGLSQLPRMAKEWREKSRNALLAMLPPLPAKRGRVPESSHARLQLATSLYRCNLGCKFPGSRVLSADNLLQHECMTVWDEKHSEGQDRDNRHVVLDTVPWNWGGKRAAYSATYAGYAKQIIKLCGLDPQTATFADMDKLDARITCKCCVSEDSRLSMNWRQAIEHQVEFPKKKVSFKRMSAEDVATTKAQEAATPFNRDTQYQWAWICRLCRESDIDDYALHSNAHHNIPQARKEDYYVLPDRFAPAEKPVRIPL